MKWGVNTSDKCEHVLCVQCTVLHRRCFYEFRRNRVHLQYAFWCANKIDFEPSVSHQLSFHTKHVQFHICIYFRYLAVCITLIENSICIYFRFLAVCTILIANFLFTLLHLSIIYLSIYLSIYHLSIINLSSIYHLSIINLSSIHHLSFINLSSIYHQSTFLWSTSILSFIYTWSM